MPYLNQLTANRTTRSATDVPWVHPLHSRFFTTNPRSLSFTARSIFVLNPTNPRQPKRKTPNRIACLRKFEKANTLILCPIN